MKGLILFMLALALTACGKTETVDSLAANPEHLKELRLQCKTDRAKLGEELCNRVAQATEKRFMGNGTPYTPSKETPKY